MKSNYERGKFVLRIVLLTVAGVVLMLLAKLFVLDISWTMFLIMGLAFVIWMVITGLVLYSQHNQVINEVENISEIMTKVVDEKFDYSEENLQEGSVGILYTNFYKMVNALVDSKRREIHEKVFLRDIISDISHQLKTPLASLNIFIDLLLEDKLDADKKKQVMVEASKQLGRMEWMVLSMLKLARIEAQSIIFEKKETELKSITSQAIEGVRNLVTAKNQSIKTVGIDDIKLMVDGDWLTEALINLLKNASDYSEAGTEIIVEAEDNKVYTRIFVTDQGIGIKEEDIPHIFDRFYRAKQNVNPDSVGIGLALTKSIVDGMGGSIKVKSEEGKYAQFIITFIK